MAKQYKVIFRDNSGNFAATAFAESFGGFVSSNVQKYDGENDLAIMDGIDTSAGAEAAFEAALDADDNVVSYAELS